MTIIRERVRKDYDKRGLLYRNKKHRKLGHMKDISEKFSSTQETIIPSTMDREEKGL
ncbi:hypothetical protein DICPUDRAFT_160039 [Dictyostelium purpureum]|uniref:Uncharacterized protein n=1 Tax=Dictyostelium purpureum TaxID=5786 RepID=F1A5K2_DICPU|nr:uncharacterized protein DICPUDRAFT_160039 [Dictyostelium purpureum]EGC28525.1 hypothetical protein DICPUDRAFT_160039 [Dictyostelium purpureum]|eukprot:XP_003294946.1 hypothetical protein DICPUDRAFT_160039 [Dictyostelium purpureum]